MAEKRDYYEVLGVSKNATDDEIKKAYRVKAKETHPDLHPDDKSAEEKFKEVNEAYDVLSNPDKKAKYDQYGHAGVDPNFGAGGFNGSGFGGFDVDLGDIFGSFFGGFGGGGRQANPNAPRRGRDCESRVTIEFEEAAKGCKKEVRFNRDEVCPDCHGSCCAPGTDPQTCPECHGTGQIRTQTRTILGSMQTMKPCSHCGGRGKIITNPCNTCKGRGIVNKRVSYSVNIPAGIDSHQTLSVREQGSSGANGGPNGDLHVTVSVKPHRYFRRDGMTLMCDYNITFAQAALGSVIQIPTLNGPVSYDLPAGTQPGEIITLKGKGIPHVSGRGVGDEQVRLVLNVPKNLNAKQKELIKQLDEEFGGSAQSGPDAKRGFFGKKK